MKFSSYLAVVHLIIYRLQIHRYTSHQFSHLRLQNVTECTVLFWGDKKGPRVYRGFS